MIAIYGSANERLRAVNVFDGLQFFRGNALTLNPDGFRIPPTNFDGRMAIVAWEGDPGNSTPLDGFSEALRFNGTTVDDGIVVAGSDPTIQPYDGTVNTSGVATSYGVDVDTFNVTALLAPGPDVGDDAVLGRRRSRAADGASRQCDERARRRSCR